MYCSQVAGAAGPFIAAVQSSGQGGIPQVSSPEEAAVSPSVGVCVCGCIGLGGVATGHDYNMYSLLTQAGMCLTNICRRHFTLLAYYAYSLGLLLVWLLTLE